MPSKMKEVISYYLLLCAAAVGSTEADCTVADGRNLICSFPFNVNSTQSDFGVYFYPDEGGEEPLLDCAWSKSQLRCIKQKDFEYKHPVSTLAEITIPRSFVERNGSYRCVPEGHRHHTVKSCRLPQEKDKDIFTTCDAKVTSDEHQVTINCIFSSPVESFVVKKNTTVVGSFTKSVCQNSTGCHHSSNGKSEVFTLILDLTVNPFDEYFCHADHPSQQVTGCTLSSYPWNENSSAPVIAGVLSSVVIVVVVVVVVVYLRKERVKDREKKKKEWNEISDIQDV